MQPTTFEVCTAIAFVVVLVCFLFNNQQLKREKSKVKRLYTEIFLCTKNIQGIEEKGAKWYNSKAVYPASACSRFDAACMAVADMHNVANEIVNELPLPL